MVTWQDFLQAPTFAFLYALYIFMQHITEYYGDEVTNFTLTPTADRIQLRFVNLRTNLNEKLINFYLLNYRIIFTYLNPVTWANWSFERIA